MISIDCVWPAKTILGEAPYWCADERVLYWVDIDGKAILRYNPASGDRRVFSQPYEIGCLVKRVQGGFIAGANAGLAFIDSDLSHIEIFATPEDEHPENRFNDGKCDRMGRFWVGSTDRYEKDPIASLYRVDAAGRVERVHQNVIVSNGLGWSPDNRVMYFTDSGRGVIYAFDFEIETGALDNRREFARTDKSAGLPDGLTVDAMGYVWSAHWGGWKLTRYAPDGRIDRIIDMPVPLVTSMAFGGENLDQMYVTSASLGLSEAQLDEAPLSGGLFRIDVGVTGLPEPSFLG